MFEFRKYIDLIESNNGSLIYHWTTYDKAITALKTNKLQKRRWKHFLENEQRFAQGTSWAENNQRWKTNNPICFVADKSKIPNNIHSINGHRTYILTQGMIHDYCDQTAYKFESTVPDEDFIEGTILNFNNILVKIIINDDLTPNNTNFLTPEEIDNLKTMTTVPISRE